MSPKLATAMVCIGIAVGSLSAPKSPQSGVKPGHTISATPQPSAIQSDAQGPSPPADDAPIGEGFRAEVSFIAPSLTNAFRVAIQQ